MFARDIRRKARKANQSSHRRCVDNCSTSLFEHLLKFVLHAQPHAFEVDSEYPVPMSVSILDGWLDHSLNPSVIKGAVETSVGIDCFLDHGFNLDGFGDISLDKRCLAASSFDQPQRLLATFGDDISYNNLGAFTGEDLRRGATNARASSCNQRDFAINSSCHCNLLNLEFPRVNCLYPTRVSTGQLIFFLLQTLDP